MHELGLPAAVASSSRNAPLILEKTGLRSFFSVVIDGSQISHAKPDPEVFQKAADALGIPYENCLVVEDAVSGVQAALKLGCQVAAVGGAAAAASHREADPPLSLFREAEHNSCFFLRRKPPTRPP